MSEGSSAVATSISVNSIRVLHELEIGHGEVGTFVEAVLELLLTGGEGTKSDVALGNGVPSQQPPAALAVSGIFSIPGMIQDSKEEKGVNKRWFLGYFDFLKSSIPNVTVADIVKALSKWKIKIVRVKPKNGLLGFTSFDFENQEIVIEIDPGADDLTTPERVAIMWHEVLHAYFIVTTDDPSDPEEIGDTRGIKDVAVQLRIAIAATNHAYIFDSVAETCCAMACEDWISAPMRKQMCDCFESNKEKAAKAHETAAKAHAERARLRKEEGNSEASEKENKAAEASGEAAKAERAKICKCCEKK